MINIFSLSLSFSSISFSSPALLPIVTVVLPLQTPTLCTVTPAHGLTV